MRWTARLAAAGALVAGGVWFLRADPFAAPVANTTAAHSAARTGVAQVTKGTLSARTLQNGTLGYAGEFQVVNKASGTVTKLPAVGQVINAGKVLYRVDGKPVMLLYGAVPIYRSLSWGTEGVDVRQLNAALVALGYATKDELDPDSDYFGRATHNALRELQDKVGLEESGNLSLGQAVFVAAKTIRVLKVNAVSGAQTAAGTVVLQASSTARQVTVELNAGQQSQVAVGDKVIITLPNGKAVPGVVSDVGKVATTSDSGTTIEVKIRPTRPKQTGSLDKAPVQVSIVTDTAKDVLSVPVNSLLALAGGGYAVEVVDTGGKHRLVGVTTGLFDDSEGKVEVTGDGLAEGQNIVVPAS
ncbi:peptidoglycan-binding protein [Sphaerisporangium perillae]|uniref:peptidoglycan-binding protein n=1 Tax=Sphaerisporangium perillae TaxID=2935860 RepID=UPI00200FB603|nr:peptidoglycan-binding protein [Sphaerisporangium perillae]